MKIDQFRFPDNPSNVERVAPASDTDPRVEVGRTAVLRILKKTCPDTAREALQQDGLC